MNKHGKPRGKRCFFSLDRKLLTIMKLTLFFLFVFLLPVWGESAYSQSARISLDLSNVSVEECLNAIEQKSEYYFMYNGKLVDVSRKISVKEKDASIKDVLSVLFGNTNVSYQIIDRQIILAPSEVVAAIQQQSKKITGRILDPLGLAVIGANVIEKGTSNGTVTDIDGNYSITITGDNAILQFSSVGYVPIEKHTGNQSVINVTLAENVENLDEVVVIGYGVQKKRDVSSAISSVGSEALQDKPIANFAQGIAGKMAGVRVSNTNSAPGGGQNIVIRGTGSVNASNSPLYVIDGFPMQDGFNSAESPLNSINPADIESIEVLKDASSSAIYGTRAANGVVLITTKKGKQGKPKINVNVSGGVQNAMRKMKVLGREDFLTFMNESRANAYLVEDPNFGTDNPNLPQWSYYDDFNTRIENWRKYSQHSASMVPGAKQERWITVMDTCYNSPYDTDWQDVLLGDGSVVDVQLSMNGGTDNMNYMISGGYYNNQGIVKNTDYERYSLRANVEGKVNNWLKVGLNIAPSLENTSVLSNTNVSGSASNNPFFNALSLPPILTPTDADGNPIYYGTELDNPWDWNFAPFVNPLQTVKITDKRRTAKVVSALYAEVKFYKDLTWKTDFHNEYRMWENNYYMPSYIPTTALPTSRSTGTYQNANRIYWDVQSVLTYNKRIKEHSLTAMVGISFEKVNNRSAYIKKYDFPQDLITTLNQATTVANQLTDARTNRSAESMIGTFARVMYNYNSKYYLTASVRRDGSSKFGVDNRWAIFPSFSLAWRVSDEKFFDMFRPYINDWKLRGGWGRIGNSGITNYLHLATLGSSSYVFGSGSDVTAAYSDNRIANRLLGWETTSDISVGTDVSFLHNRIGLSVDYFDRKTSDMLFNLPLPSITGFANVMQNIGSMRNRGFEYALNTQNFIGEFNWNTSVTLSYYRNRVTDIGNDKRPLISYNCYTTEGKPLAGIYGMVSLGPYKDWADVKSSPIFNANRTVWRERSNPGTPKAADVNGDGILDASDKTILGNAIPDFIWSMTNNFAYKGFDLSFQLSGVVGGEISMFGFQDMAFRASGMKNITQDYFDNYWRPDNTDAKYPAPSRKNYDGSVLDGGLTYSASYVKMDDITLGYTIPGKLTRKFDVGSIRVYLNINNAFMITKFPGYNPETNYRGDSALSQGIDQTASYPLARTISFGINLGI